MSEQINPYNIILSNEELLERFTPLINSSKVDYTKQLHPAPICLSVNGQSFASLGNFSLVIGKLKSRKTFFVSMALAAAVNNSTYSDLITATLPADKKRVIFIDTEQSRYKVHEVAKRVAKMSGISTPENFEVYSFRGMSTIDRILSIRLILHYRKDTGLVVIDGVRDLVTSINDEYQATSISNLLMQLTEKHNLHILVVLHENKGDKNARGHLGGELANKSESVLRVTYKNQTTSKVNAEFSREQQIPDFEFSINDDGIPERSSEFMYNAYTLNNKNRKPGPDEVNDKTHKEVLKELHKQLHKQKPKRTELEENLKVILKKHVEDLGNNKLGEFINYYLQKEWIVKKGKDRSPKAYYEIPEPK